MGGAGPGGKRIAAAHRIKAPDEGRIGLSGFRGGDLVDAVAIPEAAGAAEPGESAFGGDASSGENEETIVECKTHG